MFRTAELGRKVPKKEFNEQAPALRAELLEIQQKLREENFPVILVFGGVDGAGKGETVNLLNEWLDPRWLITKAYGPPSDEMVERPEYWRYWRDLPPKGLIGIFLSSWYSRPILDRVQGRAGDADFDEALDRMVAFENALADDGALILKFWMHLGKDEQKARFKKLEKNPLTKWRVTQTDWDHWHQYDDFIAAAERAIMKTSTGHAPWQIVEGLDENYRYLTVATSVLNGIRKRVHEAKVQRKLKEELKAQKEPSSVAVGDVIEVDAGATVIRLPKMTVLGSLEMDQALEKNEMDQALEKKEYRKQLEAYQGKLNQRYREAKELGISTILVFEGWDAAGKGGAIRRVTAAMDARDVQVIPIAAPTDEESAQHYLWRFWRHLSRAGRVTVFDRSWYGRVLVERVEGFATEDEWKRAYAEINDFEEQLVNHGIVLCKFWMNITKDEQLARFKAREEVAYKRWKLTDEDWRNREKWDDYDIAVNEMVEKTSTTLAPWTLVEGNDKRFARVKILNTVSDWLRAGIERQRKLEDKAWRQQKTKKTA